MLKSGGGGGGGTVTPSNFLIGETPAGTVNGINDTFTLSHTPSPASALNLFKNGVSQGAVGVDYTLTVATIVFVAAAIPQTGDILYAYYSY